jgi:hypothetical protein
MLELVRCSCTRVNNPWRRFCGGCGKALAPACGACKFVNGRGDRFCGGCGKTLVLQKPEQSTMPIEVLDDMIVQ